MLMSLGLLRDCYKVQAVTRIILSLLFQTPLTCSGSHSEWITFLKVLLKWLDGGVEGREVEVLPVD